MLEKQVKVRTAFDPEHFRLYLLNEDKGCYITLSFNNLLDLKVSLEEVFGIKGWQFFFLWQRLTNYQDIIDSAKEFSGNHTIPDSTEVDDLRQWANLIVTAFLKSLLD